VRALRHGNQLNHFLRAAEPVLHVIRIRAQCLDRELRGNSSFGVRRVFGDESDFIHANSGVFAVAKIAPQTIR
jgi:hypothetical protein